MEVDKKIVNVQLWDTAGQERFRNITKTYYRGAHAVLLVYDVSNQESFDNIKHWLEQADGYASETCQKFLIGNKSDLKEERVITLK